MRWMNRYDGTQDSLKTRSKRPKTPHPNAHTADEIRHIENLRRRNPNIGLSELYGKLREHYAYTRHPASLFRFLRKRGVFVQKEHKKTSYRPKKYNTPRHNGKVERLYRNDTQRFYSELSFYDLDDLNHQMKLYLKRSNRISSVSF